MFFDCLVCSFRNLGRKKMRSALTIAAIGIGVASVVLIGSIGEIGKETIRKELSSLGLGSMTVSADNRFTNLKMTEQDLHLIRNHPFVENATPIMVNFSNTRMRGLVANCVLWGIDDGDSPIISLTPQYGRMLNQADIAGAADVCVIDSNVAQLFYKRDNVVGKSMQVMINGSYITLEIVGVADSGGNILQSMVGEMIPSFAYIPYTTMQRYRGDSTFDQIAVTVKDENNIENAAAQLTTTINRFHNLERGFKADNISKQKDTLNNMLNIVTTVLSVIAGVSLIVAGLGIMTIMIVSVNERTREIGIKKSIGATGGTILFEFLVEAFIISLLGSIVGVITGLILVWIGCTVISIPIVINFMLISICVTLSVGVGIIFGVYPATVASKLHPVDALRTE